jgi:hypothetical protein
MKYTTTIYSGSFALVLFIILLFAFLAYALYPRIDIDGATQTLKSQGYTDIVITGWRQYDWHCTKDDWYRTGFEAIDSTGQGVTGVVCGGKYRNMIYLDK